MNNLIAALGIMFFSATAMAVSNLDDGSVANLMVDAKSTSTIVNYPTTPNISNICGVKVVISIEASAEQAQQLIAALVVKDGPDTLKGNVSGYFASGAAYQLTPSGGYQTEVTVKTVSGRPLREEIGKIVGDNVIVGLVTTPCKVK